MSEPSTSHREPRPADARSAFDELGSLVLSEQSMESVLQKVADLAKAVVPGAAEVSVTLVDRDRAQTAVFSGELAKDLDEQQYADGRGPCLDAAVGGEVVQIEDMATETRWPEFVQAARTRVGSSMSVPVPLQRHVSAAMNMYSTAPHGFDEDSRALARTFASYAGVALANMHLYDSTRRLAENLETAMKSRAVIDQAKGVLMAQQGVDAEQAFDLLVTLSQKANRKLRDVAQALVDDVAAGR